MEATIIAAMISAGVSIMSMLDQKEYQDSQNSFNSSEAQASRDWASESERFSRMTQLGFNPDLAAASIMGNSQSVPYAASAAPTPDIAGNADLFSRMLAQLPMDLIAEQKAPEEVKGLKLDNAKKEIENGLIGPTMQANIDYLTSYADKMKSEKLINDEQYKIIKERAKYAVPLAQEEYLQAVGTTNEIFARVENFFKDLEVKNADIDVKKALKSYYYYAGKNQKSQSHYYDSAAKAQDALASLYSAEENEANVNAVKTWIEAYDNFFDVQLRSLTGGLPIQPDLMKELSLMYAFGDTKAKELRDALLDGDRQLYDFQVETRWKNRWRERFLGWDLGDVIDFGGDALMTYGFLSGRNPKSMTTKQAFSKYGKPTNNNTGASRVGIKNTRTAPKSSRSSRPSRPSNTIPGSKDFDEKAYWKWIRETNK